MKNQEEKIDANPFIKDENEADIDSQDLTIDDEMPNEPTKKPIEINHKLIKHHSFNISRRTIEQSQSSTIQCL